MTRIETFTDAAFAFALTLLVISLDPPGTFDDLLGALKLAPAFAASFAILMVFWYGHHTWSRRFGLDDVMTTLLSCLLVFIVLIYVYPLRYLTTRMMEWIGLITGLGGLDDRVMTASEFRWMFVIYGVGFFAMALCIVLLYAHAWRRRDDLQLNAVERFETIAELIAWSFVGGTGALSALLALTTEPSMLGIPGWAYMLLPIFSPIFSRQSNKRRPREA